MRAQFLFLLFWAADRLLVSLKLSTCAAFGEEMRSIERIREYVSADAAYDVKKRGSAQLKYELNICKENQV
jgi:hypothetical protein